MGMAMSMSRNRVATLEQDFSTLVGDTPRGPLRAVTRPLL